MSCRALDLDPGLGAPRSARTALRAWLVADGATGLEERVLLVASELVTNAAIHARTPLRLSYAASSSSVEVGVHDGVRAVLRVPEMPGPGPGLDRGPDLLVPGGRGLSIVQTVADEWGVRAEGDGKRVWARWSRSDVQPSCAGAVVRRPPWTGKHPDVAGWA